MIGISTVVRSTIRSSGKTIRRHTGASNLSSCRVWPIKTEHRPTKQWLAKAPSTIGPPHSKSRPRPHCRDQNWQWCTTPKPSTTQSTIAILWCSRRRSRGAKLSMPLSLRGSMLSSLRLTSRMKRISSTGESTPGPGASPILKSVIIEVPAGLSSLTSTNSSVCKSTSTTYCKKSTEKPKTSCRDSVTSVAS